MHSSTSDVRCGLVFTLVEPFLVSIRQLASCRPGLGREHPRPGDRPERRRAPRRDGDGDQSRLAGAAGDGRHERRGRVPPVAVADWYLCGRVRSVGLSAGPAPRCAADRRLHRENRCAAGAGHGGRDGHRVRRVAVGGRRVDLREHAADERGPRRRGHGPEYARPVDHGARRAHLARYRWQHDGGDPAAQGVRAGRRELVHDRGDRRRPEPVGHANAPRGESREPRHRCGGLGARRAAQRPREVRRERLPRRWELCPDEQEFSEQQHRRRVGGRGHRERQDAREPVRRRRGPGWPHHSEQAVVLRGRAEAQPPISRVGRLQAGWDAHRGGEQTVVAHGKNLVSGEPVEPVHLLSPAAVHARADLRGRPRVLGLARREGRQWALGQDRVGGRARQLAHRLVAVLRHVFPPNRSVQHRRHSREMGRRNRALSLAKPLQRGRSRRRTGDTPRAR